MYSYSYLFTPTCSSYTYVLLLSHACVVASSSVLDHPASSPTVFATTNLQRDAPSNPYFVLALGHLNHLNHLNLDQTSRHACHAQTCSLRDTLRTPTQDSYVQCSL
jgi:hypothetical protein